MLKPRSAPRGDWGDGFLDLSAAPLRELETQWVSTAQVSDGVGGGCFWCLPRLGQDLQDMTSPCFSSSKRQREEGVQSILGVFIESTAKTLLQLAQGVCVFSLVVIRRLKEGKMLLEGTERRNDCPWAGTEAPSPIPPLKPGGLVYSPQPSGYREQEARSADEVLIGQHQTEPWGVPGMLGIWEPPRGARQSF